MKWKESWIEKFPKECRDVESSRSMKGLTAQARVDVMINQKPLIFQDGGMDERFIKDTEYVFKNSTWLLHTPSAFEKFKFALMIGYYAFSIKMKTRIVASFRSTIAFDFGPDKPIFWVLEKGLDPGTTMLSGKGIWVEREAFVKHFTEKRPIEGVRFELVEPAQSCPRCGADYFFATEARGRWRIPKLTCSVCKTVIREGVYGAQVQ